MELYGQQIEVALLGGLRPHLNGGAFVDVGAERGGIARALLAYGYGPAHLIEPAPANAEALRSTFPDRDDVAILELAVGARDGEDVIYLAEGDDGEPMPAFNRIGSPGEEEIRWHAGGTVPRRTLASLVAEGSIPERVELLKVDAEGGDREVLDGLGPLHCEALMIEYWTDIPGTVGRCPWTLDELRGLLEPRGLRNVVFVHHHRLEVRVVSGTAEPVDGDYGNLIFLSDDVYARAHDAIALVAERADAYSDAMRDIEEKDRAIQTIAHAADERQTIIDHMIAAGATMPGAAPASTSSGATVAARIRSRVWPLRQRLRRGGR